MKMMCSLPGGGVGGAPLLEANMMSLTTGVCSPCPVESLHSDHKPLSPPPCLHQAAVSFWAPCKPQSPCGDPGHGLRPFNLSSFCCLTSYSPDLPSHGGGLLEPETSLSLSPFTHTHTHTHTHTPPAHQHSPSPSCSSEHRRWGPGRWEKQTLKPASPVAFLGYAVYWSTAQPHSLPTWAQGKFSLSLQPVFSLVYGYNPPAQPSRQESALL